MIRRSSFTMAVGLLSACAGSALAGVPTDIGPGGGFGAGGAGSIDYPGGGGGYGTRGGSSVVDNDTASFQLLMYGSKGTVLPINSLGPISVRRTRPPISIGQNNNGTLNGGTRGSIMASWDEIVGATFNTIVVTMFSSDGQDLMPLNVENPSDPTETFGFWTWNFGVTDPVTWRNQMSHAPFISADYKLSTNGGQTFFSTKSFGLPNPWDGTDVGITQAEPGNGVNYLKISYRVGQVPTPGALILGGLCTLGAALRRRR